MGRDRRAGRASRSLSGDDPARRRRRRAALQASRVQPRLCSGARASRWRSRGHPCPVCACAGGEVRRPMDRAQLGSHRDAGVGAADWLERGQRSRGHRLGHRSAADRSDADHCRDLAAGHALVAAPRAHGAGRRLRCHGHPGPASPAAPESGAGAGPHLDQYPQAAGHGCGRAGPGSGPCAGRHRVRPMAAVPRFEPVGRVGLGPGRHGSRIAGRSSGRGAGAGGSRLARHTAAGWAQRLAVVLEPSGPRRPPCHRLLADGAPDRGNRPGRRRHPDSATGQPGRRPTPCGRDTGCHPYRANAAGAPGRLPRGVVAGLCTAEPRRGLAGAGRHAAGGPRAAGGLAAGTGLRPSALLRGLPGLAGRARRPPPCRSAPGRLCRCRQPRGGRQPRSQRSRSHRARAPAGNCRSGRGFVCPAAGRG